MLVTVSGVDCSGKSTQIELLKEHLQRQRGRQPVVFWYRPGYSRELDALRAWVRKARPGVLPTSTDAPERRERVFDRPVVRRAWLAMALVDTFIQYALKIRGYLLAGRDVICDRYLWDARLDLDLRFPDMPVSTRLAFEGVRRASPTPDRMFLLVLSAAEMSRRVADKNEPFPDPPEQREARFAGYQQLAGGGELNVIDAEASMETVHARLIEALEF